MTTIYELLDDILNDGLLFALQLNFVYQTKGASTNLPIWWITQGFTASIQFIRLMDVDLVLLFKCHMNM